MVKETLIIKKSKDWVGEDIGVTFLFLTNLDL